MNYTINPLPYPIIALLAFGALILFTKGLFKGHKKYSRLINLFLFLSIIETLLYLTSKTMKEFDIFLWMIPTIHTLLFIFFALWFIILMKEGIPRAWRNKDMKTVIIICGVFMSVSFAALLIFILVLK